MQRLILATLSAATLGITLASGANALKPLHFVALTDNFSENLAASEMVNIAATPGQFVTVEQDHPTTGTANVITENGQTYLVFDEAFGTASGPDVQVVLYADGETVPVNIEGTEYIVVDALQSFDGEQRYLIDAAIDIDAYEAVAIWCREFDVTFGYAPL